MYTIFETVTGCVVKNVLVCSAFLKILCESRNLLGIGTRLGAINDADLLHTYSTGMQTTRGVVRVYSDTDSDHFRRDKPTIPLETWMFMVVIIFIFIALCIYFCILWEKNRRRLLNSASSNPLVPRPRTSPQVLQQDVQTPVGVNDVPPDYTVVVDQTPIATIYNGSLNLYPKVVRGKKLETPPPAYITVAPFK